MPVLALGISYRRAPVELLERLAFTEEDFPKSYRRLLDMEGVTEGVVLSTCNRVEVFAEVASYHEGFLDLKRFLAESREIHPDDFAEPLYSHYEEDAVGHLFAVAAGLDSMVLGEPQILTQVRQELLRSYYRPVPANALNAPSIPAIINALRAQQEMSTDESLVESARLALYRAQEALSVLLVADAPVDVADEPAFDLPPDVQMADAALVQFRSDLKLFSAEQQSALAPCTVPVWNELARLGSCSARLSFPSGMRGSGRRPRE